jgi:hypothetical protein
MFNFPVFTIYENAPYRTGCTISTSQTSLGLSLIHVLDMIYLCVGIHGITRTQSSTAAPELEKGTQYLLLSPMDRIGRNIQFVGPIESSQTRPQVSVRRGKDNCSRGQIGSFKPPVYVSAELTNHSHQQHQLRPKFDVRVRKYPDPAPVDLVF